MKSTKKALTLIGLTSLQLLFFHYLYHYIINGYGTGSIHLIHSSLDDVSKLSNHNVILNELIHSSNDKQPRCHAYFDHLNKLNPNFTAVEVVLRNWQYETMLDTSSAHVFFETLYQRKKQELKNSNRDIKEIDSKQLLYDVNKQIAQNEILKSRLIDAIAGLRIYHQCDGSFTTDQCLVLGLQLFPWFTFEMPIFKRWDGTVLTKFPHIQIFEGGSKIAVGNDKKLHNENACFWSNLQLNYNGDGIVIPVSSFEDMNNALRLIKVLRYHQNILPIQLVYNKNLYSLEQQDTFKAFVSVARDVVKLENGMLLKDSLQELWFVDLSNLVSDEYLVLHKDATMLMSTIFNSFSRAIVMNPDVVPMQQNLQKLFQLPEFISTGLYIFKSRQTNLKLAQNFYKLIDSLYPSNLEQTLFPEFANIKIPQNNYLDSKLANFISDSRMTIINKTKPKLNGLLTSLHLQLTSQIHASELMWLGQSLFNEPYHINNLQPGAIGKLQVNDMDQRSLVSKQTAHFIEHDNSLLWISDGFYQCGEPVLRDEFEMLSRDVDKPTVFQNVEDDEQLKRKYLELIPLQNVIIPPETKATEAKFNAWERTRYCNDKIFKVRSQITIRDEESGDELDTRVGKYIKFPSDVLNSYTSIQKVWWMQFKTSKTGFDPV